jgi:hypothetical protein
LPGVACGSLIGHQFPASDDSTLGGSVVRNLPSLSWQPLWLAELARVLGNPDAFVAVFMAAVAVGGLWLGADAWLAYGGSIVLLVLYVGLQGLRMRHTVDMAKHALKSKYTTWEDDLADIIVLGANDDYESRIETRAQQHGLARLRKR